MLKQIATKSLVLMAIAVASSYSQTWTPLKNAAPQGIVNCFLLTDGSVVCQAANFSVGTWYKLTPDQNGSYVNGSWTPLANMPAGYDPLDYAGAVLADGRLVIVGGEYNFGSFALTNLGAIYDPKADSWTLLPSPSTGTPNHIQCIGDAPSVVLGDGHLLIGSKLFQNLAMLDPKTLTWTNVAETGKIDGFNSEEGWTLLPDGSVFTADVKNAPASERFLLNSSSSGAWVSAGDTVQDLHTPTTATGPSSAPGCPLYYPPGEMGPALLLPDGTVFQIGASGYTGIYTPPPFRSTKTGKWATGPALPAGLNVEDGPAALLPNGHVLFGASPGDSNPGLQYFEFDGTSLNSVPAPSHAATDATYYTQLLVLPTGEVLFVDYSTVPEIYTPAKTPSHHPDWAPFILLVPPVLKTGKSYQVVGFQFNGLSAGSAYGDEYQNATNYPLARITNKATGHVFYARTHDHSTMQVATQFEPVWTSMDVPTGIETGWGYLAIVANGIPSPAVPVFIEP